MDKEERMIRETKAYCFEKANYHREQHNFWRQAAIKQEAKLRALIGPHIPDRAAVIEKLRQEAR